MQMLYVGTGGGLTMPALTRQINSIPLRSTGPYGNPLHFVQMETGTGSGERDVKKGNQNKDGAVAGTVELSLAVNGRSVIHTYLPYLPSYDDMMGYLKLTRRQEALCKLITSDTSSVADR